MPRQYLFSPSRIITLKSITGSKIQFHTIINKKFCNTFRSQIHCNPLRRKFLSVKVRIGRISVELLVRRRTAAVSQHVDISREKDVRLALERTRKLFKLSSKLTKHFLQLQYIFLGMTDPRCASPSGMQYDLLSKPFSGQSGSFGSFK